MATYTRTQLRDAVLQELRIIGAQETPSAEDAALATQRCQQELEYLAEEGYVQFDIDSTIPGKLFLPLVWVMAYDLKQPYGVVDSDGTLRANHELGMHRLSRVKSGDYWGEPQQAEYY